MKSKYRRIATFNCQGLNKIEKQTSIADDFIHHNLTAMMIQEMHLKSNGIHVLKTSDGRTTLHLYNSGKESKSINGVGILIRSNLNIKFKPISDRIYD